MVLDNENNDEFVVNVSDALGRTLQSQAVNSNGYLTIETSNLPAGTYFVTLISAEGLLETKPVVIK